MGEEGRKERMAVVAADQEDFEKLNNAHEQSERVAFWLPSTSRATAAPGPKEKKHDLVTSRDRVELYSCRIRQGSGCRR